MVVSPHVLGTKETEQAKLITVGARYEGSDILSIKCSNVTLQIDSDARLLSGVLPSEQGA